MSWLVFHIVSGDAYFSGLLLVIAGHAVLSLRRTRSVQRSGRLLLLIGWILAGAGLIPGNTLFLLAALAASVWSIIASLLTGRVSQPVPGPGSDTRNRFTSLVSIPLVVLLIGTELSGRQAIERWRSGEAIHVIGDSLSAGVGGGEGPPWPHLLGTQLDADVHNHAQAGATARSANEQTSELPAASLVIVEIGGNDLLGGRSAQQFHEDLDALLSEACADDRRVVMFELPLPPFFFRYGKVQRSLAQEHKVRLIPRRLLADVLFSDAATLDSIHLSESGHQKLAERVADLLR